MVMVGALRMATSWAKPDMERRHVDSVFRCKSAGRGIGAGAVILWAGLRPLHLSLFSDPQISPQLEACQRFPCVLNLLLHDPEGNG